MTHNSKKNSPLYLGSGTVHERELFIPFIIKTYYLRSKRKSVVHYHENRVYYLNCLESKNRFQFNWLNIGQQQVLESKQGTPDLS